ncbi:MAG: trans-aconitate 2-methyltransferase [Phycisphaeraceae bacterium]
MKSTVDEIRSRFDKDVDRFSNLETGQNAAMDAPLCMGLVVEAAVAVTPGARSLLDIGCGAGNYTLKLLERFKDADATLVDLSQPMLDRAALRVGQATAGRVTTIQADIRESNLGEQKFDVAVAAAVLHHLRSPEEWLAVLEKIYASLKPGGSLWIVDLVAHAQLGIQSVMQRRYGDYLAVQKDEAYRDEVFAYIEKEDSPAPVMSIVDHLRSAGFVDVEVLHKHACFAALGGVIPKEGIQTR